MVEWTTYSWINDEGFITCFDKSKLKRKIYDDCIVYEYDNKPFLRLKRERERDNVYCFQMSNMR